MTADNWRESSACYGHPHPELWDQTVHGESSHQQLGRHARAKTICAGCPVRDRCLTEAMRLKTAGVEIEGIWGGQHLDAINHRISARRPAGRPTAEIVHSTEAGAAAHRRRGEDPCAPCHQAALRARTDRKHRQAAS